jgi:hypothetical protein
LAALAVSFTPSFLHEADANKTSPAMIKKTFFIYKFFALFSLFNFAFFAVRSLTTKAITMMRKGCKTPALLSKNAFSAMIVLAEFFCARQFMPVYG